MCALSVSLKRVARKTGSGSLTLPNNENDESRSFYTTRSQTCYAQIAPLFMLRAVLDAFGETLSAGVEESDPGTGTGTVNPVPVQCYVAAQYRYCIYRYR